MNNQYQAPQQQQYQAPQQQYQAPQQAGQSPADDDDLDMNGTIQNDGQDFVLLPAGTYPFTVVNYESGEYQEKPVNGVPGKARKKVIVHLQIEHDGQKQTIKDHIALKRNMEWKFCQFFKAIGDRKKGEPLVMDWPNSVGKSGKVKIKLDSFRGNDGSTKQSNKVDKYLDPSEASAPAQGYQTQSPNTQMQQPAFQQPAQQNQAPAQQPVVQGQPPASTGQASQWNGGGAFK